MENKKLGILIIGISVVFAVMIYIFSEIAHGTDNAFCIASTKPATVLSHIFIGGVFSTLSLGVYLLFFSKGEEAIINRIEHQQKKDIIKNKFDILLMGLNEDEKKILSAVKDQDGITQHTLGIRTDLHKSKLSIIVGMLEKKGLIKKEKKGKTNKIFLRINFEDSS